MNRQSNQHTWALRTVLLLWNKYMVRRSYCESPNEPARTLILIGTSSEHFALSKSHQPEINGQSRDIKARIGFEAVPLPPSRSPFSCLVS